MKSTRLAVGEIAFHVVELPNEVGRTMRWSVLPLRGGGIHHFAWFIQSLMGSRNEALSMYQHLNHTRELFNSPKELVSSGELLQDRRL